MLDKLVVEFVGQRELARKNHAAGAKRPYCTDPIINTYRFCNVRREDDKVTRWIKKHWRDPYQGHPNMAGAMLLARLINWPPTLAAIGFPEVWRPGDIIETIKKLPGKVWSSAYIVSTCGKSMPKVDYVVDKVDDMIGVLEYIPWLNCTLESYHRKLCTIDGLGAGFLAAQVVVDLKYTDVNLLQADDWKTFAVSGPGSKRGLARVFGLPTDYSWKEYEWKEYLEVMIEATAPKLSFGMELHAQDWQNVMCEFDKWCRVRNSEGRPRARYSPDACYTV